MEDGIELLAYTGMYVALPGLALWGTWNAAQQQKEREIRKIWNRNKKDLKQLDDTIKQTLNMSESLTQAEVKNPSWDEATKGLLQRIQTNEHMQKNKVEIMHKIIEGILSKCHVPLEDSRDTLSYKGHAQIISNVLKAHAGGSSAPSSSSTINSEKTEEEDEEEPASFFSRLFGLARR